MSEISYKIPNISCEHCVHTIKMELGELKGVNSVEVDLKSKVATIQYEAPATTDQIENLLADINYPAEKSF